MDIQNVGEIDLIFLVESHLGKGLDAGNKWVKFNCPFCRHIRRDMKRFLLVTNGDEKSGNWFICKYCGKRGDALEWMREYRKLSFSDALSALQIGKNPNVKLRKNFLAMPTATEE